MLIALSLLLISPPKQEVWSVRDVLKCSVSHHLNQLWALIQSGSAWGIRSLVSTQLLRSGGWEVKNSWTTACPSVNSTGPVTALVWSKGPIMDSWRPRSTRCQLIKASWLMRPSCFSCKKYHTRRLLMEESSWWRISIIQIWWWESNTMSCKWAKRLLESIDNGFLLWVLDRVTRGEASIKGEALLDLLLTGSLEEIVNEDQWQSGLQWPCLCWVPNHGEYGPGRGWSQDPELQGSKLQALLCNCWTKFSGKLL